MDETESAEDRAVRLATIKRQIVSGSYETLERLDAAVEAILDDQARGELLPGVDRPPRRAK